MLLIDPPSGWQYGFPKPIPNDVRTREDIKAWLMDNGYPSKMCTDSNLRHCRWIGPQEEIEQLNEDSDI